MEAIEKKPKVSVCVITYNQEKYIRQCLLSIVDQETDFCFEVIVGDDCSTDGTPEIILEFSKKYPSIIIPIINEQKIGGTQNYVSTHLRARGEFVAHVDGDDLVYPGKLQLQSDYLDKNNTLSLVWHCVEMFNDAGVVSCVLHKQLDECVNINNITRKDVLRFGSLGAASSMMYRKSSERYLHEINGDALDYYFSVMLLEHGNAARMDSILGGYRFNVAKKTLSKSSFRYFNNSPMRSLYANHLKWFYLKDKNVKDDIFLNSLFNLLVELRFLRSSSFGFLLLVMKTSSLSAIRQIPDYFFKSFKLRSK